jgi:DNA polymerase III subunit epsilon
MTVIGYLFFYSSFIAILAIAYYHGKKSAGHGFKSAFLWFNILIAAPVLSALLKNAFAFYFLIFFVGLFIQRRKNKKQLKAISPLQGLVLPDTKLEKPPVTPPKINKPNKARTVIIDTETTGFGFNKGDRIIEIACLELISGIPTGNKFHTRLNPQRYISKGAEAKHGLSREMLKNEPLFAEVAEKLIAFIGASKIIAHNAPFDRGFINSELLRAGYPSYEKDRFLCTLKLARQAYPEERHNKLEDICLRLGVDLSNTKLHSALNDCEVLAEALPLLILKMKNDRNTP